jgi:hypothetical protein
MQAQEIEAYLAQPGQELADRGVEQPVRMLLIGGVFMLTRVHNRLTTDDVDVFFKDIEDTTVSPLYQQCRAAIRAIANRNHLKSNWLNDIMGDSLRETGRVPPGTLWRVYGVLEVYLPPAEFILALKLMAGRQKDRADILALCQRLQIQDRQQAQRLVDLYIPDKQLQQLSDLDDTLDEFF